MTNIILYLIDSSYTCRKKTENMTIKKLLYNLHEEHKTWLNTLAFYADDIKILNKRLAEVAAKNNSKETLAMVEHFQNKLIIQQDEIDKLNHNIREHEQYLEKQVNKNETAIDKRKENDHPVMRNQIETFTILFDEMRKEFYRFLSGIM